MISSIFVDCWTGRFAGVSPCSCGSLPRQKSRGLSYGRHGARPRRPYCRADQNIGCSDTRKPAQHRDEARADRSSFRSRVRGAAVARRPACIRRRGARVRGQFLPAHAGGRRAIAWTIGPLEENSVDQKAVQRRGPTRQSSTESHTAEGRTEICVAFSRLTEIGEQAVAAVAASLARGGGQLIASRFYEAMQREL